ncbi:Histidine triad nucleotide-binding protein 3 [Halocaridina rubra]|uniref:Adenosine 5'-monophosphoramidase HINT3 n=1 Tax=Halocaridina rubra TaxID=373956 RepID=A0AAN8XMY3_HALRR
MIYKCVGNIFKDYTHWPARVVATMTTESSPPVSLTERDKCIFCKICDGIEPNNIVHQDEDFVVFPDIRPAAPHHYLIVPRHHYLDVRHLSSQHVPMIEKMVSLSKEVLTTQGGSPDTARLGFHMPPFITVKHLHLHIIAPEQEMGLIARGIFKANSFWFASPESVIQKLREKPQ